MAQAPQQSNKPEQCDACLKPFEPDPATSKVQWVVVEDFKVHPNCFRRKECNDTIARSGTYHKKDDDSFICIKCTQQDYGGHAQITDQENGGLCYGCNQQIGAHWIMVL